MLQSYRLFQTQSGIPLNGATLMRGDSVDLRLVIAEPSQDGASLRFVAKSATEFASGVGVPLITKAGGDFAIAITGNVLQADFKILPQETSFIPLSMGFVYDLERTIGSSVKTIEQGHFSVVLDVAT